MVRLGLTIFVLTLAHFAYCSQELKPLPKAHKVFIVVCDGLTFQDIERMGEPMATLLNKSAIGLMSGASAELEGKEGVYVTLGSGRRAKANEQAQLGFWLERSNVSVSLVGNGILTTILGRWKFDSETKPDSPKVTFVSVSKSELNPVLSKLLADLPEGSCLWLLVPNSPQTGWMTRRLTPILVFGQDVPVGLLTSLTTRRTGLVSSVDFAPTLLAQLGIPCPATVTGRPMGVDISFEERMSYLHWLDERSNKPLRNLPALIFAIVSATVAAVSLVIGSVIFLNRFNQPKTQRLVEVLLKTATFAVISGMSIPASLFFVVQLPHKNSAMNALQFLALICLCGFASLWLAQKFVGVSRAFFSAFLTAAGIVCAFSAIVALLGVPLYWATPLGHYPNTGWRYFGITNSGIGIALAGTIFAWKLLNLPNRFVLIWLAISPLLAGSPFWGANFGGALTLAIGFATAWEFVAHEKPSWRKAIFLSVAALLLTVFALAVLESLMPFDQQAHFGLLLHRAKLMGFKAWVEMVQLKLELVWKFFARTPLNFLALSLFVAFHFIVAWAAQRNEIFSRLKPAFSASLVGGWAGLVLNDSGMEMVGMAMVIMGGVFFAAVLEGECKRAGMQRCKRGIKLFEQR